MTELLKKCSHTDKCQIVSMSDLLDAVAVVANENYLAGAAVKAVEMQNHLRAASVAREQICHFALFHGDVAPF